MCGICGMVALDGGAVDERAVRDMAGALVHRGPDDEGLFADGPAALAARRLSIIDLARGHQPMASEDGTVHVVQNGELYEHRRLQAELEARGHRFGSHCDTEVLPHLYEERGDAFAEGLRGMFAIALCDARRRRLLLARDPFGIKPLYYRVAGGVLSFASELKALVRQPGFAGEVDLEALEAYLAFNSVPAPMSIYRGVRKLPAGHLLDARDGRAALRHRSPRARAAPRRRRAAAGHRRRVRRTVRGLLGAADVRRLAAGGRPREGRVVRRGRRRAVRRLLHVRRRRAGRAVAGAGGRVAGAAGRRAPAELVAPRVARVQ